MKNLLRKRYEEKGASDIVVVLLMIPLVLWLLLSLIDVGLYFQTRTMVQNVASDAAREAAIWGGNNSPLNPTGKTVAQNARDRLWDGNQCRGGLCEKAPVVKCTPDRATYAGRDVSCTITYYPSSVASDNPIGAFASLTSSSFTITETARSETGFS